jgi:hypothetical protein
MAAASIPAGFFRAHTALKGLTIQEKLVRMNSFRLAGRTMAGPMATFAAAGAAYAAADCITQQQLGRRDTLTGVMGGLAVGAVVGLKRGSLIQGIGFGSLCAGVMLVTDFFRCARAWAGLGWDGVGWVGGCMAGRRSSPAGAQGQPFADRTGNGRACLLGHGDEGPCPKAGAWELLAPATWPRPSRRN